ncbi:unnamed protein product [Rotaria socialis]|uniref:Tetratricopeptide repeat protein n=1 Tax=Rotaria socialis TaxID=392032 RepID=A0A821S582_9BILA|nr:unnamed protein product [Rotaria socialis]CAF4854151.1 unnamed protein product [Rotaria socialis]
MSANLTKETVTITQKQDDPFSVGDWLYWMCEYGKARECFQAILKQPSVSNSDMARCYKSMGAVEVELKNYDEALNIYNKYLDILAKCDSTNREQDIMSCYVSIGKIYWLKHDYDKAIAYHHQALKFALPFIPPTSRISAVHNNLASIYTKTKQFDLALEHFQRALEIDLQYLREDHLQFGQTYANMGTMYQSKQNYEKALEYFEKARETWLRSLSSTHPATKKIENTICNVKSKLGKRQNCSEDNFYRNLGDASREVFSIACLVV